MAGPSNKIEISYEQLSTGKFIKNGNDLTITTKDLWGDTETVLLEDYFLTSPDLVTSKGSTLKGNIVNLLAIDSQPLDHGMLAFEDPNAIGKITIADGPVVVQRADQLVELNAGDDARVKLDVVPRYSLRLGEGRSYKSRPRSRQRASQRRLD